MSAFSTPRFGTSLQFILLLIWTSLQFTQEARCLPCVVPVPPNEQEHSGRHVHSTAQDVFHFCNARCEYCEYYCTLPLSHKQPEHATSHGSMSNTAWFVHGENNGTIEVEGRKFSSGDSGAPMLCSLVCKSLGRHIHIDKCRSADDDGVCGGGPGIQHINDPDSKGNEDLISHRVFLGRSGEEMSHSSYIRSSTIRLQGFPV